MKTIAGIFAPFRGVGGPRLGMRDPRPVEGPPACGNLVRQLRKVRWGIRLLALVELLAWSVVACCFFFWLSYGVDRTLVLPLAGRVVLLLTIPVLGAFLWWRWGSILARPFSEPELALVLERAFPELGDLAVTAAEGLAELRMRRAGPAGYRQIFLQAVAQQVDRLITTIRVKKIFRVGRPLQDVAGAAFATALVFAFSSWADDEVAVWSARWIRWEERPWPVRTGLVIKGFYRSEEVILRGEEKELAVAVDQGMPFVPRLVKLRFVDESRASRETLMLAERTRLADPGPFRRFVFRLANVSQPLKVSFAAGDRYVDKLWIKPKEPAVVASVEARVEPPAYVEREPTLLPVPGVLQVPSGSRVQLRLRFSEPVVHLEISGGNRPAQYRSPLWFELKQVRDAAESVFDRFVGGQDPEGLTEGVIAWQKMLKRLVDFRATGGAFDSGSEAQAPGAAKTVRALDTVGLSARIRRLYQKAEEVGAEVISWHSYRHKPAHRVAEACRNWLADWEETIDLWTKEVAFTDCEHDLGVVLTPVRLFVLVTDRFGLKSNKPTVVEIQPNPDRSPRVAVEPVGIGSAVTPLARVPIEGEIEDDYGVGQVALHLRFIGPDGTAAQSPVELVLAEPPRPLVKLAIQDRVDLSRFALPIGTRCQLRAVATDRCDLPGGPNRGESPEWVFEVVSPEELRLRLEKREILLRQQLEQTIGELAQLREQIVRPTEETGSQTGSERAKASEGPAVKQAEGETTEPAGARPAAGEKLDQESPSSRVDHNQPSVARLVRRAIGQVDKSQNDVKAIHGGILQIRDEIVNNRLGATAWVDRLENRVIPWLVEASEGPLRQAAEELRKLQSAYQPAAPFPGATGNLPPRSDPHLEQSLGRVATMIEEAIGLLSAAQEAMLELEDFRRVVEMLREIVDAQEKLLEATRQEHRRMLRELLERPFDQGENRP